MPNYKSSLFFEGDDSEDTMFPNEKLAIQLFFFSPPNFAAKAPHKVIGIKSAVVEVYPPMNSCRIGMS